MFFPFSILMYSLQQYCIPRSEWCIIPMGSIVLYKALLSALLQPSASRLSLMSYPTIFLENRSVIKARYINPSLVDIYVISDTHTWLGLIISNSLILLLYVLNPCAEFVVFAYLRFLFINKPSSLIKSKNLSRPSARSVLTSTLCFNHSL